MSKKIFEEAPSEGGAAIDKVRKAARQLAYDTKYKVKQKMGANVSRMAPAAVTKAYLAQLAKSPAPGPVKSLAQKILVGKGVKEEYNIDDLVATNVANVMYKVFVDGIEESHSDLGQDYLSQLMEQEDKKYKVVVTDAKTGNQYRRMATREKIAELRANPNIKSVEISEYGEPVGTEKNKGEQTAKVKSGKGLDPVGKEDSDVNNDGKVNKTDKYLQNRRNVRGAAISSRKSKVSEAVEAPVKKATKDQNDIEIVSNEEKGVDNKSIIKVFPEFGVKESAHQKFLGMLQEKKLTKAETAKKEEIAKSLKQKYGKTAKTYAIATAVAKKVAEAAECGMDEKPKLKKSEGGVTDPREIPTKVNLVKNKLRSMGLKMSYELEGDQIDEVLGGQAGDGYIGHPRLGIKNPLAKKQTTTNTAPKNTGIAGRLGNRASEMDAAMKELRQSYEPKGEVLGEEEYDRARDRRQEVGGVSANADQKPARPAPAPGTQRKRKRRSSAPSALDLVRQSVIAKHGSGSLMK